MENKMSLPSQKRSNTEKRGKKSTMQQVKVKKLKSFFRYFSAAHCDRRRLCMLRERTKREPASCTSYKEYS